MHRHTYRPRPQTTPGLSDFSYEDATNAERGVADDVVGPMSFMWDDDDDEDDLPDIDGDEEEDDDGVDELNFDDVDYGRLFDDDDEDDWDEVTEEEDEDEDSKSEPEPAPEPMPTFDPVSDNGGSEEDGEAEDDESRLLRMFAEASKGAEDDTDDEMPSDGDLAAIDLEGDW
ncbi:MAG: hypothetical protein KC502_10875 [Myxococcales bacterium]|nr:hypothetical protein [Myxococcales bacterium]